MLALIPLLAVIFGDAGRPGDALTQADAVRVTTDAAAIEQQADAAGWPAWRIYARGDAVGSPPIERQGVK